MPAAAIKPPTPGRTRPFGVRCCAGAAAALALAAGLAAVRPLKTPLSRPRGLPAAVARRADLDAGVTAAGWLESAEITIIRCELERLAAGAGSGAPVGGSSTIIELIPEGTTARRGDLLCRLDSSRYEELVVQQQIEVEWAQADRAAAAVDLEVARIALREYREGLLPQTLRQLEGQVASATAELNRQDDRLAWSRRMLGLGYVAAGRVGAEEQTRLRADLELKRLRGERSLYRRYSAPQALRNLEIRVEAALSELAYRALRVRLEEERLALYRLQVDRCTIRAPHDGLVIYANRPGRTAEIAPGAPVRRRQQLFFLPDLSRMEVRVLLHETVVDRVRAGMPARIRPESSPARCLTGRLLAISPLPVEERGSGMGNQVKYYEGRIALDDTPVGLRPGMSCEVHIATVERRDALAIPAASLTVEGGRAVCHVVHGGGIERRTVAIGQVTPGALEVLAGLGEGEEVSRQGNSPVSWCERSSVVSPLWMRGCTGTAPSPVSMTSDRWELG
jgi:HlyD family secretion protein